MLDHLLFQDIQNVVKKFVGIDTLVEELVDKLGNIQSAYIIGDYARGNDSGLIDLALVGDVNNKELHEMITKTENLINRKIRTLVLNSEDMSKLNNRLNIEHALCIWTRDKTMNTLS